ncbi:MAG: carbon storage regulator CsrA [Candidatus Omnitrophica bacterium]|nr:carbon storage regulator CsrA [Candidatus Omnitrophota bacterium]
MLVLSRKPNESIIIGDEIEVKVVEVRGEQVKLGITAPRNISVHRKEIYLSIQEQNKSAAKSNHANIDKISQLFNKNKKEPPK